MLNKRIAFLLAAFFLVRLYLSAIVELGNDEVYYTLYARYLSWSYFDHPAGVALLLNLSTGFFHFTADYMIRLGPVLLGTLNMYLIYRVTCRYFSERAGYLAALLYGANSYTAIIAGVFILPDSPQLSFWILALEKAITVLDTDPNAKLKEWMLLGLYIALSVFCKIHGLFILLGIGIYLLLYKRKKLLNYRLYICGLLSLLGVVPTLIWNFQHDFLMYAYHSSRVGATSINLNYFGRFVLGQLLYQNPFVFVAILLVFSGKKYFSTQLPIYRLVLCLFFPLLLLPLYNSLFKETLPHWSGPAYLGMLILAAQVLANLSKSRRRVLLVGAYSIMALLVVFAYPVIQLGMFVKQGVNSSDKQTLGKGDFTLDISAWETSSEVLARYIAQQDSTTTLLSYRWFPTAHLDHYLARPKQLKILCLGEINEQHEYYFINQKRGPIKAGENAWYITFSNYNDALPSETKHAFTHCEEAVYLPIYRNNKLVKYAIVYHLINFKANSSNAG